VRASVIIPSYNARERLYLNLTALNGQSYENDDVEVIVIDNGSDDNTMEMLQNFKLKYPLKLVRIEENQGIAYGRNMGVSKAEGDILIFHDSDMIASKDFLRLHLDAHKEPNVVACGMFWRRVFTYYYKKFSVDQHSDFEKMRRLMGAYKNFSYEDGCQLISEAQVKNEDVLNYSFDLDIGFINDLKNTIRQYGQNFENYYLPWRFFITNNLSVERANVMKVGMFDTNIVRYGYEDYDLGVRLYKSGCRFLMAENIVSVHQEHPANYRPDDLVVNINYMCGKYNNIYFIDVVLVCLSDSLNLEKGMMNEIAHDIYKILSIPEYHELLELFIMLLQVMRKRFFSPMDDDSKSVYYKVGAKMTTYIKKTILLQRKEWVPYFIQMLFILFKLALNIDFERLMKVGQEEDLL
jgi:glycosyltransferase involved in cell wall biosynthesis